MDPTNEEEQLPEDEGGDVDDEFNGNNEINEDVMESDNEDDVVGEDNEKPHTKMKKEVMTMMKTKSQLQKVLKELMILILKMLIWIQL